MKVTLYNFSSFKQVFNDVKDAKANVSFWGIRYIYTESKAQISLDYFVSNVFQMTKKKPDFDESERNFALETVKKLKVFYSDSKNIASNKNFITRLFFYITEFWMNNIQNFGYGIRFTWKREREVFKYYTKEQYQKVFGNIPQDDPNWIYPGYPKMWARDQGLVIA